MRQIIKRLRRKQTKKRRVNIRSSQSESKRDKGKNSYEQKHIDYAKKVIEFVETYNKHLDGPSNDRERQDAMNNYDQRNAEHIKESLKNYEKSKQAQPSGMNL